MRNTRLLFIFSLCTLFCLGACKQNEDDSSENHVTIWDADNIAYINNSEDEPINSVTNNSYKRTDGNKGIIGTWEIGLGGKDYCTYEFKTDGTYIRFERVTDPVDNGYNVWNRTQKGDFKISINHDTNSFILEKRKSGDSSFDKFTYRVSDNYLLIERN